MCITNIPKDSVSFVTTLTSSSDSFWWLFFISFLVLVLCFVVADFYRFSFFVLKKISIEGQHPYHKTKTNAYIPSDQFGKGTLSVC